jgi:hypothetical protein
MSERQDLDLHGKSGPEQTMDERDGGVKCWVNEK